MPAKPADMVSIIVNHGTPAQRVFATVPVSKIEDFGARQVSAAFRKDSTSTVHYLGPWTPMDFASNKNAELTLLERNNFVEEN